MGFGSIITSAVALANTLTAGDDGLQVEVWHWPALSRNEFGTVVFDPAARRTAIVEQASRVFRGTDGKDRVSETKITILSAVTVTADDAFALVEPGLDPLVPAPTQPANVMGQILDIKGLLDANGQPYMVEVWMGQASGR
jgi:hypothetical protein